MESALQEGMCGACKECARSVQGACGQMGQGRVQLTACSLRGPLGIQGAALCNSISRGIRCHLKSSISLVIKVTRQNIKI